MGVMTTEQLWDGFRQNELIYRRKAAALRAEAAEMDRRAQAWDSRVNNPLVTAA